MGKLSAWMRVHGHDIYYRRAKSEGQSSRAFFKLKQIDEKYHVLRVGLRVLDLGSAPGGWVGYELRRVGSAGMVVAVDLNELGLAKAPNLLFLKEDVEHLAPNTLQSISDNGFDVVASDLAPKFSGVVDLDMERHFGLVDAATSLAHAVLKRNGWFIVKLFQCSLFQAKVNDLRKTFSSVYLYKPS
ncbi:MAG: RlmE family RNA methyltransferase, partial [Thermoprotei archaeon]